MHPAELPLLRRLAQPQSQMLRHFGQAAVERRGDATHVTPGEGLGVGRVARSGGEGEVQSALLTDADEMQ